MNDKKKHVLIRDSPLKKTLHSEDYNFSFDKRSGLFIRWGRTVDDDPVMSPVGPEILDLEISVGRCRGNCPFCYKNNGSNYPTTNMPFEKFRELLHSMPPSLTQIAFGITDIDAHPEFTKILRYTRERGIIPNFTTNGFGVSKEFAEEVAGLCGAVAVSLVEEEVTYDAVQHFIAAGMSQVNIHFVLAEETLDKIWKLIEDMQHEPRLRGVNALVILSYKPKGRGIQHFTPIKDISVLKKIMEHASRHGIGFGFDSCSAPAYLKATEGTEMERNSVFVESCEAGLFSFYANVHGEFFPCSFLEGEGMWGSGLTPSGDFSSVWNHTRLAEWREKLLRMSEGCDCKFAELCHPCPYYDITPCLGGRIELEVL